MIRLTFPIVPRTLRNALCVLVALAGAMGPVVAESRIQGYLRTPGGDPATDGRIYLVDAAAAKVLAGVNTNEDGSWAIEGAAVRPDHLLVGLDLTEKRRNQLFVVFDRPPATLEPVVLVAHPATDPLVAAPDIAAALHAVRMHADELKDGDALTAAAQLQGRLKPPPALEKKLKAGL